MSTTDLPALEPANDATDDREYSQAARVVLAVLAAGAGAIHLAMVAPHAQDSTVDGVLFAVAGWVQITLALFLFARPSRRVLGINIAVNLGLLAVWAASRTVGLPWGAHAGEAEDVGSVDLICAAFEVVLIIGSFVVAARPRIGENIGRTGLALTAGIPALAVMALTTASLVSEDGTHGHDEAGDHHSEEVATGDGHDHASMPAGCEGHDNEADHAAMNPEEMAAWNAVHEICGGAAGHDEGADHHADAASTTVGWDERCDAEFNIASYWYEAETMGVNTDDAGHEHDEATMDHHANGMHEQEAARLVQDLAEMTDEEYEEWLVNMNPANRDPDAPDDTGSGGHMGAQPWIPVTDAETCETMQAELDLAYETAMKYPTVAEAKAAGYFMVAPYVPGIASHWMNYRFVDGEFDIEEPEMLLFDGNADNAQVVGLSYYIIDPGEDQPTVGFTGDNDLYHRHVGLCMKDGVVIADTSTSEEECEALGGHKGGGQAGWMSHAWVVPGCESPWGVFSAANPVLDRQLIDNQGQGEPCSGSAVADRYDRTPGPPADS
jgi:hypothetical protein